MGIPGFDLVVDLEHAENVWDALVGMGAVPTGEDAAEMVRVEQGVPRYGRELSEEFNPLEAGLLPSISFDKGCYIGQEVVVRLNTYDKVQKRLMGIAVDEGSPQPEQRLQVEEKDAGWITSVVYSPLLQRYSRPGLRAHPLRSSGNRGTHRKRRRPSPGRNRGVARDPGLTAAGFPLRSR